MTGLRRKKPVAQPKPNPGSQLAREMGCVCPVLDNNHGEFAPAPPDGWYIREDCELHVARYADDDG